MAAWRLPAMPARRLNCLSGVWRVTGHFEQCKHTVAESCCVGRSARPLRCLCKQACSTATVQLYESEFTCEGKSDKRPSQCRSTSGKRARAVDAFPALRPSLSRSITSDAVGGLYRPGASAKQLARWPLLLAAASSGLGVQGTMAMAHRASVHAAALLFLLLLHHGLGARDVRRDWGVCWREGMLP